MCKPTFHSRKLVIIDSSFCVLQGMIELKNIGVLLQHRLRSDVTGQSTLMDQQLF
jgi:hypothetical protein